MTRGTTMSHETATSHGNVTSKCHVLSCGSYFYEKLGHLTREISHVATRVHAWKIRLYSTALR